MKARDPVALIEAAYGVELEQRPWLESIARTASAVNGSTLGAAAMLYDATSPDWISGIDFGTHAMAPALIGGLFNQSLDEAGRKSMVEVYRSLGFATLRNGPFPLGIVRAYRALLDDFGIADVLCSNATDPTHRGCLVLVPTSRSRSSVRQARLWRRLAAHVSAGVRLRRSLDAVADARVAKTERAEAILRPNGQVEHAVGPATGREARERLQEGLVRIDRARSRSVAEDEAVALWQGLVHGRWSIVEHFERDGKRYYLAHRNDPQLAPDRALTERERQVLSYAELGYSNKLIAYSLGISTSTVSTLLTAARRKLGGSDQR
jgi:DNA-binding CsgD family transcriptional regulator